jgi:hypothetical protein
MGFLEVWYQTGKKAFLSGGFSKEVKQLKKENAELKQVNEETCTELGKTQMELAFLKKKMNL